MQLASRKASSNLVNEKLVAYAIEQAKAAFGKAKEEATKWGEGEEEGSRRTKEGRRRRVVGGGRKWERTGRGMRTGMRKKALPFHN